MELTLRAFVTPQELGAALRQVMEAAQEAGSLRLHAGRQQELARERAAELADVSARLTAAEAALQARVTEVAAAHEQLHSQLLRLTDAESQLKEATAARMEATAARSELQLQLDEAEAELRETLEKFTAAHAEAGVLRGEIDALLDEIDGLRRDNRRQREELAQWRLAKADADDQIKAFERNLAKSERDVRDVLARLQIAEKSYEKARAGWDADRGRVEKMRGSASWRLTMPLRAIERKLRSKPVPILPFPAPPEAIPGAKDAAAPIGRRDSRNGAENRTENEGELPAKMNSPPLAAGVGEAEPPPFRFHLDQPTNWRFSKSQINVRGWCVPMNGHGRVARVRARALDQVTEGRYGLRRPDVAGAFKLDGDEQDCGFEIELGLPPGPSTVSLEVLDHDGRTWTVGEYEARAPYSPGGLPERQGSTNPATDYASWVALYDTLDATGRRQIRAMERSLRYRPLISVVMPTYNTDERWLTRAIDSVRGQLYTHWELCIADDASTDPNVRRVLERYAALDPRIKVTYRPANGHISASSNSALELVRGEFIALLDHDDELALHALYAVAAELNAHPDADLIYSDEDKIDERNRRSAPYFKPDWNPDLFLGQNYLCHLAVYRASCVREVGGFRVGVEGCQDWDLALRVVERTSAERIRHLPRVLYHWRAIAGSTALAQGEKSYINEGAARVLRDHFERTKVNVELVPVTGGHWRVRRSLPDPAPLVSIIIPTRNHLEVLRRAVDSVLDRTTYSRYEILIVDNQSDDPATLAYLEAPGDERIRVIQYDAPFNYSAINNHAVSRANGELVCLLNNDVEAITPDWLEELASHAMRPEIGAVGVMLYYPNDTVQHAGCVLGVGGVAGHAFKYFPRGTDGQFNRARLVQNYTAVTAACLMIRRAVFEEVGGLDAENLRVGFNDVDFCLRVHAAGYRNLWTPFVEFYHHESISRGLEDSPEKHCRFHGEITYMRKRWGHILDHDPAYNPNLTLQHEDFTLACPPRVPPLVTEAGPG